MYISDYLLDHLICGFTGFSLFSFILKLLNGDRRCLLLTRLISSLTVLTFSIDESGIYATRDAAKNVAKKQLENLRKQLLHHDARSKTGYAFGFI